MNTLIERPPTKHTFFMLVRATTEWLQLSPPERFTFVDATLRPILARIPAVSLRYFDSEAFNSRISDVMMWETTDVDAYSAVVEELRETRFWDHYFEIVEIIPSVEDGYATHYGVAPVSGTQAQPHQS